VPGGQPRIWEGVPRFNLFYLFIYLTTLTCSEVQISGWSCRLRAPTLTRPTCGRRFRARLSRLTCPLLHLTIPVPAESDCHSESYQVAYGEGVPYCRASQPQSNFRFNELRSWYKSTEADRCYELLTDEALRAVKASPVKLTPKQSAPQAAFQSIARACLRQL
jgi:hypothetical protein